jgi:hypothetical protein
MVMTTIAITSQTFRRMFTLLDAAAQIGTDVRVPHLCPQHKPSSKLEPPSDAVDGSPLQLEHVTSGEFGPSLSAIEVQDPRE